jgi:hypothetical protein
LFLKTHRLSLYILLVLVLGVALFAFAELFFLVVIGVKIAFLGFVLEI